MSRSRESRRPSTAPFFSGMHPRILAHRGLALTEDENTLGAFAAALHAGAQILETDVRATRDGVAVLIHDETFPNNVGESLRVKDSSLGELRAHAGAKGGAIASLREALEAFPEAKFNVDVKSEDAILSVVDAVVAAHAQDRVLIASFSGTRRRATVRRLPGVARSASSMQVVGAVLAGKLGWSRMMRWVLSTVDAVQIPEKVLGLKTSTSAMITRFHAAGVEIHVWTVNDEAAMLRLLAAGVDGIVTDRTDIASRVFAL